MSFSEARAPRRSSRARERIVIALDGRDVPHFWLRWLHESANPVMTRNPVSNLASKAASMLSISSRVRDHLELTNCDFKLAGIDEIATDPDKFGGPFTTVLNIGTCHYLYWGGGRCSTALYDHREILSRFAKICTKRLIFSARLEIDRLPSPLREEAEKHENKSEYTTDGFLKAALNSSTWSTKDFSEVIRSC
jgi:hypothetical protein